MDGREKADMARRARRARCRLCTRGAPHSWFTGPERRGWACGTILDQIDLGAMALPELQRGYVWNRDQVRGLMHSLYLKRPVGSGHRGNDRQAGSPVRAGQSQSTLEESGERA